MLVHANIAESSRLPYEFHKVAYFTLLAKDNIRKGGGGVGCWEGWGGASNVGREGPVLKCIAVYCVVNYTGSVLQMCTCMCVDLYV